MNIPKELLDRITWAKKKQPGDPDRVESIDYNPQTCEDCGTVVNCRRLTYHKVHRPTEHWRICCKACGKYKDPRTGKYELTSNEMQDLAKTIYKLKK